MCESNGVTASKDGPVLDSQETVSKEHLQDVL
jgi:hypothetical protein